MGRRLLVRSLPVLVLLGPGLLPAVSAAGDEDWPMWRHDPGRTAASPLKLPERLHLLWTRELPRPKSAFRNPRLQFDRGYEPVVSGKTLFVGSPVDDRVVAYDTESGREMWAFRTDGPVRLAPVAWRDRLFVGSDDGHLYCLDAAQGTLHWKFRAVPSRRKVLGNGRLISLWPLRGGPVVAEDTVYFAAGVWPFEGIFVYALDAASGNVVWVNDRTGFLYGQHPHDAQAFGGVSPQGYLVVAGDDLVVPCGTAYPATFDRKTGRLKDFALPKAGREPGGWFAALDREAGRDIRRGKVVLDKGINREVHEGGLHQGAGLPGVRSSIVVGGRTLRFEAGFEGVEGAIHTMLAADGKLFVVSEAGGIFCFGAREAEPVRHPRASTPADSAGPGKSPASEILQRAGWTRGYALAWGIGDGRLLGDLLAASDLRLVAFDPDRRKVDAFRAEMDRKGIYGVRAAAHAGTPREEGLPPYVASLIVCEEPVADASSLKPLYACLRPYGGAAYLAGYPGGAAALEDAARTASLAGARVAACGDGLLLVREGGLPGATNYVGDWKPSRDEQVRAPLGVLWFDDDLGHFKRSPQPMFVDGVMASQPKDWTGPQKAPFKLLPTVYSDVYTGRILAADEPLLAGKTFPLLKADETQPYQYREHGWDRKFTPPPIQAGNRVNPMTGETEKRQFPKSYGCDGGVNYGFIYSMRSGTPAFYDQRSESGTIHVSGPRSGCTNSLIPANGLLNVPFFYEGCTCSYPLPAGLALVSVPAEHEQWASWGEGPVEAVRRVGINLGAPGDRTTEAGTLWLDVPAVGGPSPKLRVATVPEAPEFFYRHSVWIEGGRGWPWVAASGARGLEALTLSGLRADVRHTVRLTFADPEHGRPGERVFDVSLQGRKVLENLDVAAEAGGAMRALVREFGPVALDGTLRLELRAKTGATLLCGVEHVAEGLPLDAMPVLDRPAIVPLSR